MIAEVDKTRPVVIDEKQLAGKWELRIETKNSNGARGFGGRMLTSYKHPLTGKKHELIDANGDRQPGYTIGKLTTIFDPENIDDMLILQWLLGHPEVTIDGIKLDSKILSKKLSNSSIKLKNLDKQHMDEIDAEDLRDQVIGRLSEESGPKAIGLKRLRILCAYLNLPYYDKRHIRDSGAEKKLLRAKVKRYANTVNPITHEFYAVDIKEILDEVDNYEAHYKIKEMIRLRVIVTNNQMYKFENWPVGSSFNSMLDFFNKNPDVYLEAEGKLLPLLKEEGFKV